jgi:acetyltransferase
MVRRTNSHPATTGEWVPIMGPSRLASLFNPGSVAVLGASDSGRSVGSLVFRNLREGGFTGPIHPVNPKYQKVAGLRCHADVKSIEGRVELAVIATPADTVPLLLRQCADAGIPSAIVISAGFGETGEAGRQREAELREIARAAGIRFIGPNCVGLVRPALGLNATFLKTSPPAGRLALVSQSGALCSAIADYAQPHHLGFSALVSLGNSVDVGFGDTLSFLASDTQTEAILLYVEGIRDARSFLSALRLAARHKPVLVLKAGRHHKSSEAAHTHTGALIGSDAVFDSALELAGAVRVDTFGQLFAAAEILAAGVRAGGARLGIVTNGGGAGVLAADRAGDLHLELPPPSAATIDALDALLPAYWSRGNPVDILGDAPPAMYGAAVKACMADPAFDGLLVMLTPQAMTDATAAARAVIDALPERKKKPLLACWMGETSVAGARDLLSASGIPDFASPEGAVEAYSYLARHERSRRLALETPGPLSENDPPDLDGARMIVNGALAEGRTMLSDLESKAVLRAFHIPANTTMEAGSATSALVAAETLGFPVVLKILSPQISHKSDVGGVRTNIMTAMDVQAAYRELTEGVKVARPDASVTGVTVEAMVRIEGARELVVGVSRDPVFGPVILFGAGGTMVEVLKDSAVSLPPLNEVLAERLIHRTRVSRLLDAFRDRAAVDQAAVIGVLMRVSDLVCELPEIEELDINPLFAGPEGVIAVDCRIRVARPPASLDRYEHMAVSPYPRHLVQTSYLSDGTPLLIRPIRPDDAEREQAFVRNLSSTARKYRFMSTLRELSPDMLAQFTQIDYGREMALIAVTESGGRTVQHGVARYVINPDDTSCEFAVVVSDELQHQGIGTRLMKALMDAARQHGLKTMEGTVLAENRPMLTLMEELGFSIRRSAEDGELCLVERYL